MRIVVIVLTLAFAIVVTWIAVANSSEQVRLSFAVTERDVSLAEVIFVAVFAGALFAGLLAVIEGLGVRMENLRLKRRLRRLQEELHDLRNLGLSAESIGESRARSASPSLPPSPPSKPAAPLAASSDET
ncbi:MAG: DUF1049 domain-containing protein [Acidobacteriota bacterium]|nr:MAG: DUF1049 domain-containing protein [Acidobacteriota bacterium]